MKVESRTGQVLPELVLHVDTAVQGSVTVTELAVQFEYAIQVAYGKESDYKGAWRAQGWMGNLARIMSKTSRLRAMLWRTNYTNSSQESVADTALDQMNLLGFFLINMREGNRWGRDDA